MTTVRRRLRRFWADRCRTTGRMTSAAGSPAAPSSASSGSEFSGGASVIADHDRGRGRAPARSPGPGRGTASGRPSTARARRSVEDTSRRGTSTLVQAKSSGRRVVTPGRSTTTTLHAAASRSGRCQVCSSDAASAPRIRNSSASGHRPRSSVRVSTVYDGPPRRISRSLASTPSTPSHRGAHQLESLLGRRDATAAHLLPRLVGHHHEHQVQRRAGPRR